MRKKGLRSNQQLPSNKSILVDSRKFNKVRSRIIAMVEKGEIPSMAVAVAKEGDIIWEEAFGWANQNEQIKATPHTIYLIASLSKSLTATGIMILAERKQLSLDDPVEKYIAPAKLTTCEGQGSEVTVRRVLNMASLLRNLKQIKFSWCCHLTFI